MEKLTVTNVSKKYRKKVALQQVSCEFSNGITALLGPNGAGKSTLMNIICTILNSDEGIIEYKGYDIKKLKASYLEKISVLFQNQPMYKNYTAIEYLYFCGSLKNMARSDIQEQGKILMNYFGIYDNRNKKISTFSGGMKQRLALCGVFLGNPRIILLDEPSVGLDIYEREELKNLLFGLKENCIIIISTHIVSDIENIADNVIMLNEGKISAVGTQNELVEQLRNVVWELPNNKSEIPNIKTYMSNGKRLGISDIKPHPDAKPKVVDLTDVYFYFL